MREVRFKSESWPTKLPFRISGYSTDEIRLLVVEIKEGSFTGRAEAAGLFYLDETPESMLAQAESIKAELEQGIGRDELQQLLPSGGARNAIDCALWDLEAKQAGRRVWEMLDFKPIQIVTVNTVALGTPENMAAVAKSLDTPILKIKLDDNLPLESLQAIRAARPDAELVVDVNQGWSFDQLVELAPKFSALGVTLIEQPLPRGGDAELEGYQSPIKLCADESCLDSLELARAARRYSMLNIKLDKTGGLTEALDLIHQARSMGLGLMAGNMLGTSLGMAPAFVIAQLCDFADLDGPLILAQDREHGLSYTKGVVSAPVQLCGVKSRALKTHYFLQKMRSLGAVKGV